MRNVQQYMLNRDTLPSLAHSMDISGFLSSQNYSHLCLFNNYSPQQSLLPIFQNSLALENQCYEFYNASTEMASKENDQDSF